VQLKGPVALGKWVGSLCGFQG